MTKTEATTTRSSSQTCDSLPPPCPPIDRAPRLPSPPTNVDPPTQVGATSNVLRSSQRKRYVLQVFQTIISPPFLSLYLAPHWIWISRSIAIFFALVLPNADNTTTHRTVDRSIDQREYQAAHSSSKEEDAPFAQRHDPEDGQVGIPPDPHHHQGPPYRGQGR